MKVGVFLPTYAQEAGGGYTFEQDVLETLVELAEDSGHSFTIFPRDRDATLVASLRNSTSIRVFGDRKLTLSRRIKGKLLRQFQRQTTSPPSPLQNAVAKIGVDIMWFVTPLFESVDVPYIATVWDLQHRLQPWFPEVGTRDEWNLREKAYSELLRRASFVLTGTKSGKDEISYFYNIPSNRVRILPHPTPSFATEMDKIRIEDILNEFHLNKQGFLLYPAQFWPHKNHANLLLAVKMLHEKHSIKIPLVLVGSNQGNLEYIKGLTQELGLEDLVHFLGFVNREKLIALYQGAFALMYVTHFGPENLPPLEAFALGCPVIASAVQGASEQLGEAAVLINPNDPEAIADSVEDLWDNPPKRNDLISLGYQRANRWTCKDFVRGVFSIIDEFEAIRRCWPSSR